MTSTQSPIVTVKKLFHFLSYNNHYLLQSSKPATTDKGKVRNKRQYYMGAYPDDDSYLMRELWDKPVGLGFFVNPKGDGDEGGKAIYLFSEKSHTFVLFDLKFCLEAKCIH